MPPWDLQCILVALGEDRFEPLRQVDMEHLTYKTLFLVALASAWRISELHAVLVQPPFLIDQPLVARDNICVAKLGESLSTQI